MYRLHEDDLAGQVMAQKDWDVVRFPAIAEGDEVWTLDSELGQYLFTRQPGETLHPESQPVATLDQTRLDHLAATDRSARSGRHRPAHGR